MKLESLFDPVPELVVKVVAQANGRGTEGIAAIREIQSILLKFEAGAKATGNDDGDAMGTERGLSVLGDMLAGPFWRQQRHHFVRTFPFWMSCVEHHRKMAMAIDDGYRIVAC